MLPGHVRWPACGEHEPDGLGIVVLRGIGELSAVVFRKGLNKVRPACQQSLEQILVPQFACMG